MIKYEDYANMIKKKARDFSKSYNVPYEELYSEGNLIYCECLENFDILKASFSTFFYMTLNFKLSDFCKHYNKQIDESLHDVLNGNESDDELDENNSKCLCCYDNSVSEQNLLDDAKSHLSDMAYTILNYILSRKWEIKGRIKPCKTTVAKALNTSAYLLTPAWEELANYWNTEGIALY